MKSVRKLLKVLKRSKKSAGPITFDFVSGYLSRTMRITSSNKVYSDFSVYVNESEVTFFALLARAFLDSAKSAN